MPLDHYSEGHWRQTLELELMGYGSVRVPYHPYTFSYKLSSVSVAALEDMGYPVRHGLADPFWVTVDEKGRRLVDENGDVIKYAAKSSATMTSPLRSWRCGVGAQPQ